MAIPMHYETAYEWSGSGEGGTMRVAGVDPLAVGAPATGVDQENWTPEHMLLGAVEVCLLNTFVVIGGMSKLTTKAYRSTAEGDLTFEKGNGYRFERIVIRPVVTVSAEMLDKAKDVLQRAHRFCLISRSMNFPVEVEPEFVIE